MNLSKNFTLAELTRTGTGLPNSPNPSEEAALRFLCETVLQPLRDAVGPLKVTSGFRCAPVNKAVGGAPGSQHQKGEAVDVMHATMKPDELAREAIRLGLPFDQLMRYDDKPHLHLSATSRRAPRGQVLQRVGGQYVAWKP